MDRYSRTVAVFKVLLPLVALGILATLFLLSRAEGPGANIPFADSEIMDRTRDQQITRPFFSGVTEKGDEITVIADTARPGTPDTPGGADNIKATLKTVSGAQIKLNSDSGIIDLMRDSVTFLGNVRISTSTGYLVLTDTLNSALNGIKADTPGQVKGSGPIGRFTAGRMEIVSKTGDGDVHILFKDGVNLIYEPEKVKDD